MAKSKLIQANRKIAENITDGFKKMSDGVVKGYTTIEDAFVDRYLTKDDETVADAKARLKEEQAIHISGKTLGGTTLGIAGALLLGVGMCLTMVWSHMILGIVIGVVGIVVLLFLIPFFKGLK